MTPDDAPRDVPRAPGRPASPSVTANPPPQAMTPPQAEPAPATFPPQDPLTDVSGLPRLSDPLPSASSDPLRSLGAPPPRTPDLARSVQAQLVDVARTTPNGTVEVKLAPEELGRVHMTVSQSEADVTITVVVERPETLDLMRRHADMLSTELRQAGFERLSFSFGQGGDPNNTGQDTSAAPFEAPDIPSDPDPTDTPTSTHGAAPLALGSTRLDIRL